MSADKAETEELAMDEVSRDCQIHAIVNWTDRRHDVFFTHVQSPNSISI